MVHKLPLGSGDFVWMKTEMQVWVQSGIVEDKNTEGGQRGCLLGGTAILRRLCRRGMGGGESFQISISFYKAIRKSSMIMTFLWKESPEGLKEEDNATASEGCQIFIRWKVVEIEFCFFFIHLCFNSTNITLFTNPLSAGDAEMNKDQYSCCPELIKV